MLQHVSDQQGLLSNKVMTVTDSNEKCFMTKKVIKFNYKKFEVTFVRFYFFKVSLERQFFIR